MGAAGGDGGAEEMTIGTDGFFQVGMLPTKTVAGRIVVENIVGDPDRSSKERRQQKKLEEPPAAVHRRRAECSQERA